MPLPSNPPRQMRGADGTNAGASGYVPAPAATDNVKLLHGDGTFKAVSNASAATDAQAAAGTSSTTFVTPANAKYAAASVVNPRSARGGVAIDGTANSRVFALLTGQTIGTDAFSLQLTFKPTSATQSGGLGGLSSSATDFTSSTANTFSVSLNGGSLQIYITGAVGNYAGIQVVGFASTYLNETVQVVVVKTSSGSAPLVYVNGVLTATTVAASSGTAPWSGSVASTYLGIGFSGPTSVFAGPIFSYSLYNLALDQASITEMYEGGAVPERFKFGSQVAATNGTFTGQQYETFTGASAAGFTAVDSVSSLSYGLSAVSRLPEGAVLRTRFTATLTSGAIPTIGVSEASVAVRSALTPIAAGTNSIDILTTSAGSNQVQFSTGTLTSYAISGFAAYRLGAVVHFDGDLGGRGLTWYDSSTNALNATLTATGVTWTKPSLGSPLVSSSITSPAATDLTLAGGTAGSSAVKVTNTTAATSTTTGSLQTAGGLGVAGAGWFGGKVVVGSASSLNTANIYSYGTLKVGGAANQATGTIILGDDQSDQANIGIYRGTTAMALGTGNWLNLAGYDGVNITAGAGQFGSQTKAMALTSSAVSIPLTTAATNTTSGALQVAGGVGVQGAGYFGGNGAFGPAFTPNAWGTGGQLDVNGTTGGILGVAYNGTAKGYVLAETGGILVNSHAGGTAKFNTTGSGATTIGNSGGTTLVGDVALSTVGKTVSVKSGTNALAGTVTLASGAGTITSSAIDVNTVIVMSIKTLSGAFDHAPSVIVSAGSATIDGHNADNSTYNWVALKVA